MKRSLPLVCIILAIAFRVFSEPAVLVPREVFVGDAAELTFALPSLSLTMEEGSAFEVPSGDFPVSEDFTITSILIRESEGLGVVVIRFVPWVSGIVQIPVFSARKIHIAPPPVRISSLVDKTGRNILEGPRSPLLVPGTTYVVYGLIAAAVTAILLIVFFIAKFRNVFEGRLSSSNSRRRVRVVMKRLRYLEKHAESIVREEWYRLFSSVLRGYTGSFCGDSFASATGTEIVSRLGNFIDEKSSGHLRDSNGIVACFQDIFTHIDSIRFGSVSESSKSDDIGNVREVIRRLETEWETALAEVEGSDV